MPTPPVSTQELQECVNAYAIHKTAELAAKALGMKSGKVEGRLKIAKSRHIFPNIEVATGDICGAGADILVIPDMHHPFGHPDTLSFLTAAKKKFDPRRVVCLGDETDQHVLGRYEADPDGYSAGHEHNAALEALHPIYELFPLVSVCTSNHGERIFKRTFRAGIPKAFMKDYKEFMDAPKGWNWEHKFEIKSGGEVVVFEHGEGVSGQMGAMKRALSNGFKNTVIGHLHADAGILWQSSGDKTIFAMNAGCLINAEKYAFAYGKNSARKPMIGLGIIHKAVPSFIPMKLDINKRWTGDL